MPETPLTDDHAELSDAAIARRYFAKFDTITGYLPGVANELEAEGRLNRAELQIIGGYVRQVAASFRALSFKYLMTGRTSGPLPGNPTFDRHESGFPIAQELMAMAVDAQQSQMHLAEMASETELKDRMIRAIVGDLQVPAKLQFALSQRLYYEALAAGGLFWVRNDPQAQWVSETEGRRKYLLHLAIFDTQINLPILYLMDLEDSGTTPLPKSSSRWPSVQAHLMAQSASGLKLLTIAQGFDVDFDDLHPKRLRRFYLGPMYSHDFTLQSGPISEVLTTAKAEPAEDWALVWTLEDLRSERTEEVKEGWFSSVERQIYTLDPIGGRGAETGASSTERMVILPERPYQALSELDLPGLRDLRKFVVGAGGRIISSR